MKQGLRNFLAVALSLGVLIIWYTFIAPPPKPQPQKISAVPSVLTPAASTPTSPLPKWNTAEGKEIFLENEEVRLTLNTEGGSLTGWKLKKYEKSGEGILNTPIQVEGAEIPKSLSFKIASQSPDQVAFSWESKELRILKSYHLPKNSYRLEVELEVMNKKEKTVSLTPGIEWRGVAKEESPQRGILFFKSPPDRWQPIFYKEGSFQQVFLERAPQLETRAGSVDWIGTQSRYFLSGVVPLNASASQLEIGRYNADGGLQAAGPQPFFERATLLKTEILPKERWVQKLEVFSGPKKLALLKEVGNGFEKAIGYGWTTVIALPILYLLQLFYKVVHNYGLSIILLTVLIKILLNPINRKSLESMKAMQALQPRLKELQAKFKDNKEKLNLEMMQLFKTHKVNPMSGCLPMLLQLPIYIALYRVLWGSVELYQAPFFWFYKDLSAPDPYLITPILLGITMLIQTKMTPSTTADPAQQKMMMLMPLMFCAFMIFLPMGLGLYILVNTSMTILQQWMYRKGIRTRDLLFRRG